MARMQERARRLRTGLAMAAATAAGAAVMMAPGTAQAAPAPSYSNCPTGDVCFYTGSNGTGKMCNWAGNDKDWRSGSEVCSWSATTNVRSIYNNGRRMDVAYYKAADHKGNRIGCTKKGKQGNLAGTYTLRSHKWLDKC
ncbi:peptidase inhibitor family I36 protein [Streptomyces sp. XM4193]|uniref:peptidase inhibitor family I36 protein n=1 Tax=Streptomyces sp. XM4193 TaxID=2929782 RepID=UPI001FF7D4F9|nr:peptidase inhibitor family I36 protein [Streptomyces sp. XM4193]MCK1798261.1 peptidase inhibitor family I36 protein [Streptomyces sp. XM4193]